jgi:hypothetical protein
VQGTSSVSGGPCGHKPPQPDLQRAMRNSGINICFDCELQVVRKFAGKHDWESEKENRPVMLMLTVKCAPQLGLGQALLHLGSLSPLHYCLSR